jgi:hypothetical protein
MVNQKSNLPIEVYSKKRQAEFLLSNAVNEKDYERAKKLVQDLGMDPMRIKHYRP